MKRLILPLFVLTFILGCLQTKSQPYLIYSSYDKYASGNCDTINSLKFNKRSMMSMIMWGGGGYTLEKRDLNSAATSLMDTTNIFIIAHGDTLYINCTQIKRGGRPGYARGIDINGQIYFEANLRGSAINDDPEQFATSEAGKDGIIGAAAGKAKYITTFFVLDPKTMRANKLQTDTFLQMLQKISPTVHDEYQKAAMNQTDIEALYPETVWPYIFMLKENSTKLKTQQ